MIKLNLVHCAAIVTSIAAITYGADAQLTPDRTYYGINRPIPMHVEAPADAEGPVSIHLLAPGSNGSSDATIVAQQEVEAGGVDLAGLFPILWTSGSPEVMYAQLVVNHEGVGPAVVLQPMLTPQRARAVGRSVQFDSNSNRVYSGLRAYTDKHMVFDTTEGEIEVALRPDQAPNTAWSIRALVDGGYYTDIIVHRIVPLNQSGHPFVIQFGDPTGTGVGGPGYFMDLEDSRLDHTFGVMSMARAPDPDTNGSQVFICLSREGTSFLDPGYVSFGQTVRGADTIIKLENTPLEGPNSQKPKVPPVINRAWLVPAPPYGTGPAPVTRPSSVDGSR